MRFNLRRLLVMVAILAIALGILCHRASQQRNTAKQLLENELVAIQFSDGDYCETLAADQAIKHFFYSINVVYIDVPRKNSSDVISLLKKLPALYRVVVRYQGNDMGEYLKDQKSIAQAIIEQENKIRDAFPNVEILNFSTTVEYPDRK